MTQEEKQLLLKDLCARLPHKVKIKCDGYPNGVVVTGIIGEQVFHTPYFIGGEIIIDKHTIDTVRPYLRPMSSMTEEEFKEYHSMLIDVDNSGLMNQGLITKIVDWLDSKMFDHRNLIPKGLALEAPNDMYKN